MGGISVRRMVDKVKVFIGFVLGVATMVMLAYLLPEQEERYYDCRMAEWHPDIPAAVKEECRKRQYEHWKQEQKSV